MTPTILQLLMPGLRAAAVPLSRLHDQAREAGSAWSRDQLLLFCTVAQGLQVAGPADDPLVSAGDGSPVDRLLDAVAAALAARGGGPLPVAEIQKLLPPDLPTSAAQIRAVAKDHPTRLRLFGPGLIQLHDHA